MPSISSTNPFFHQDIDHTKVENTSDESLVESQKIDLDKKHTTESTVAWDEEAQFLPEYNKESELPTVEQDSKEWFEPDEGPKSDHDLPPGWTYSENGMLLSPPSIQLNFVFMQSLVN